jgi:hypothetical protein
VKRLTSFIFTYLIDFYNKTGFQGLVVARISRMSGFNSKFGGGGATNAMPRIP